METTRERERLSTAEVVRLLPEILDTADKFHERTEEHVAYKDLLSQADGVIAGVTFFATDEFLALDPVLISGAIEFEASQNYGFVAMGRLLQLRILIDYPEVVHIAVERAERELSDALHHGRLSARMGGDETPAE